MTIYIIGVIGQWVACVILSVGIAIEIKYGADIGFMAITIGSVLFAVVTKIKVIGKEKVVKEFRDYKKEHSDHGTP